MIRIICFLCLIFSFTFTSQAQKWNHDFEASKKIAQEENKNILLVFKGSDWCAPCMKLDQKIFTTEYFISNYNKDFVLLEADFPRKKKNALSQEQQKANNTLASTYNQNGHFPLVVVLDSEGTVLGKTGYNKLNPTEYLNSLIAFTH